MSLSPPAWLLVALVSTASCASLDGLTGGTVGDASANDAPAADGGARDGSDADGTTSDARGDVSAGGDAPGPSVDAVGDVNGPDTSGPDTATPTEASAADASDGGGVADAGDAGDAGDAASGDATADGAIDAACPLQETLCGSTCVDLTNSQTDCGSCGHACGEGTCALGRCTYNVLGSSEPVVAIATDTNNLYFANVSFEIGKIALDTQGTGTSIVSTATNTASGLATDGTNVYWTESSAGMVEFIGVAGGPVSTIATGRSGPSSIAWDALENAVVWGEASGNVMTYYPLGGTPTTMASGPSAVTAVAAGSRRALWATSAGSVAVCTDTAALKCSESTVTLASGLGTVGGIAIGTGAFWDANGTVDSDSPPFSAVTEFLVATGRPTLGHLAADASYVYWVETGGESPTIVKSLLAGGGVTTLAVLTSMMSPTALALGGNDGLYFTAAAGGVYEISPR